MNENPYAAPQAEPAQTPTISGSTASSPYGPYRNVSGLRLVILILLGIGIICSLLQIFVISQFNSAYASFGSDDEADADLWLEHSGNLATFEVVAFYITVVIWCIWKNKSCKNAWLFRSAQPTQLLGMMDVPTPGWAVGGYFVPILNLWKPYQAMVFIRDQVASKVNTGPLVGFWWASFLTMRIANRYFFRDSVGLTTVEEVVQYNQGVMIGSGITIVATVIAAILIHKISTGQKLLARELGLIQ